jgi:hypothetical protein
MYVQDKVPTVQQIRVGRGALTRVRKSLKKELVGSWIYDRDVEFFLSDVSPLSRSPSPLRHRDRGGDVSVIIIYLMGNANNLWQVRQ